MMTYRKSVPDSSAKLETESINNECVPLRRAYVRCKWSSEVFYCLSTICTLVEYVSSMRHMPLMKGESQSSTDLLVYA
jgi:hypothetical protein